MLCLQVYHQYFSTTSAELDEEGRKLFSLELKNKNNDIPNSLEDKLSELKLLFEKGLIPESVYLKKISELV